MKSWLPGRMLAATIALPALSGAARAQSRLIGGSHVRGHEMSRSTMYNRIFAIAFAIVTLAAGPCMAQGCDNETIKGTYLFTVHGKSLNPATPSAVLVWLDGVTIITFDGNGGSTQQDFVVHNAVPPNGFTQGETGTYTVNADCTGTAETKTENGSVTVMLVVSPLKGTIHEVVTSGAQVYADGERISDPDDNQQ